MPQTRRRVDGLVPPERSIPPDLTDASGTYRLLSLETDRAKIRAAERFEWLAQYLVDVFRRPISDLRSSPVIRTFHALDELIIIATEQQAITLLACAPEAWQRVPLAVFPICDRRPIQGMDPDHEPCAAERTRLINT